jgi:Ca-activated chloride channel family protein
VGFFWPLALWLLLLLPLVVWVYRRNLKHPGEAAVVHPRLSLLQQAHTEKRWRSLPTWLYLGALLLGIVALARPNFPVPEADPRATIMLSLDVSRSMQATDVQPNRFEAAKEALKTFVRELPDGARVGLVTFARYAQLVVAPTDEHTRVIEGVDLLQMDFGTAIGDGLMEALEALPSLEEREAAGEDPSKLATVILLSDGRNFNGTDPLEAALEAAKQRVRVHTVGVGWVKEGPIPGLPERSQYYARFDEETLRAIAEKAGGRYVFVDSAEELREAYRDLSKTITWFFKKEEASAVPAFGAGILLGLSLLISGYRRLVL